MTRSYDRQPSRRWTDFGIQPSRRRLIDQLGRTAPGVRRRQLADVIARRAPREEDVREWVMSQRPARRRGAFLSLAAKGVPSSLEVLVRETLSSGDRETRCAAAGAVAAAGDRHAVCALLTLTRDLEADVRAAASAALHVLSPSWRSLEPATSDDLRTFAVAVYAWLLSGESAPTVAQPMTNMLETGEVFASTPQAVAELMTTLEGAKSFGGSPLHAGATRVAIAVALSAAAFCARRSDLTAAIDLQKTGGGAGGQRRRARHRMASMAGGGCAQ